MKPLQLAEQLKSCIQAKLSVLITGAPGIGKTEIILQVGEELNADVELWFASMSDPTEPKGLPARNAAGDGATFLPYGMLQKLINAKKLTICVLDDFGQAQNAVQAAFMQPLGAHTDGNGNKLSPHVVFIAATNRKEDKAGVQGLLEPVKSRFATILNLEVDDVAWVQWALANDVPLDVIAYIRYRPAMLQNFIPSNDLINCPCPRTVYKLGQLIKAGVTPENEMETFTGAVGKDFASEFIPFRRIFQKMPNPDTILVNPASVEVPKDVSVQFAIATVLARKTSANNISRVVQYVERMPDVFQTLYIQHAVSARKNDKEEDIERKKELQNTRTYIEWHSRHSDLMV